MTLPHWLSPALANSRMYYRTHRTQLSYLALSIGFLVVMGITTLATFFYLSYKHIVVKSNAEPSPIPTASEPAKPRPFTIAMMGYGGGTHEGGRLTDSIIVALVDDERQQIALISVPRDVWVPLEVKQGETSYWKINAAYAIGADDRNYPYKPIQFTGPAGGGEMAKTALAKVVGFPIDHFMALDFAGFVKSIDVLNGVDVRVERTFDDFRYPIEGEETNPCGKTEEEIAATAATLSGDLLEQEFTCRYEHLHFDRGVTHMDGLTALKYVRSRHSDQDGGDFGRAARQRNLILAVKKRVLDLNFVPKAIPFVSTLSNHLTTDVDFAQMEELASKYQQLKDYQIVNVALTSQNVLEFSYSSSGQSILVSKEGIDQWGSVHQFITDSLAKAATASATPTASASALPSVN